MSRLRVAVVAGGWSNEVQYSSSERVHRALEFIGHSAETLTINEPGALDRLLTPRNFDCAFIRSPGAFGEDGKIQAVCDIFDVRYTGSGATASSIGMDKLLTKHIVRSIGLDTPRFLYDPHLRYEYETCISQLGTSMVVKPIAYGESKGVFLVKNDKSFQRAKASLVSSGVSYFIEEYLPTSGREFSVGILETKYPVPLPVAEVTYEGEFFSDEIKHSANGFEKAIPARLRPNIAAGLQRYALRLYQEIGCHGFARVDFVLTEERQCILEINTVPGLSDKSLFPAMCLSAGLGYTEMIDSMLSSAFARRRREPQKLYP